MKSTLIALVAAVCAALPAAAAPVVFSYTGAIQTWTVALTGTYVITAVGAQGGSGSGGGFMGGRGASIHGSFDLLAGQTFSYAVGGVGESSSQSGGGGGGTFFVGVGDLPLLVAGGGGGIRYNAGQNGCDASVTVFGGLGSGDRGTSSCLAKTDDLGMGGELSRSSFGAGGAGFNGDGADDVEVDGFYGTGGKSWGNGLAAGQAQPAGLDCVLVDGGFGGGGSGSGCAGGGGGGGYSGGDGGWIAGGGGSWNTGYNALALAGVGVGNGSLSIDFIGAANAVPEPGSLALGGVALLGAAVTGRRRQPRA